MEVLERLRSAGNRLADAMDGLARTFTRVSVAVEAHLPDIETHDSAILRNGTPATPANVPEL